MQSCTCTYILTQFKYNFLANLWLFSVFFRGLLFLLTFYLCHYILCYGISFIIRLRHIVIADLTRVDSISVILYVIVCSTWYYFTCNTELNNIYLKSDFRLWLVHDSLFLRQCDVWILNNLCRLAGESIGKSLHHLADSLPRLGMSPMLSLYSICVWRVC